MPRIRDLLLISLALSGGCATRAVDVAPLAADPADFVAWECVRIDDEIDLVRQRTAELAWSVDERAGNNILALGVGVALFWPAILAMRPDGPDAVDLARLKGRDDALRAAARLKGCPPPGPELPPARAAALPVALGDRLVYEDRRGPRKAGTEWALRLQALRRGEFEYRLLNAPPAGDPADARMLQDLAGNVVQAPPGELNWPHLLRSGLVLGQVTGGDILVSGDPLMRARMRGQVVAVGSQTVAGRQFDVAVIELFGDAPLGESSTRVEGVIVVDRVSGVLLRLDLHSARPAFELQRRLMSVESAPR